MFSILLYTVPPKSELILFCLSVRKVTGLFIIFNLESIMKASSCRETGRNSMSRKSKQVIHYITYVPGSEFYILKAFQETLRLIGEHKSVDNFLIVLPSEILRFVFYKNFIVTHRQTYLNSWTIIWYLYWSNVNHILEIFFTGI